MRTKNVAMLAVILGLVFTMYELSLAGDDFLRSMERDFIKIVEDVSPAIAEVSAAFRADEVVENVGTGIIIDRNGYIVTTESVVGGANRVQVNLADGRDFEAKIVGTDPDTDIALVKIDAENLPTALLGDSDALKAGSWVVTIGRSYGRSPTLSFGIVGGWSRCQAGQLITML